MRTDSKSVIFLLVALVIFASFIIIGCNRETENIDNDNNEILYYDFEPVTDIKEGQKDIYVVLKVLTNQYWQDMISGITDAGNESGCNVFVGASVSESDWEAQRELIAKAIERNADALILAPVSSVSLSNYIDNVRKDNIPVILVDTILNGDNYDVCYMTDDLQAGKMAAKEMLRLLYKSGLSESETADIAIEIASVSSQTVIDRLAGFNQYWSANAPKAWTVLDEVKSNDGDVETAKHNCIYFLKQYPNLKGFFGCNNSTTVGYVNGLTEENRNDIVLVGFDYADEIAQLIRSEKWNVSTVVQKQYDMGYQGLLKAVDILNGGFCEIKFFDTGTFIVSSENYEEYESLEEGDNL